MAKKKKEFENIVEESFEEGYKSEPEVETIPQSQDEQAEEAVSESVELTENELRLRQILAGDPEILDEIWNREERSTYYLTDLHRACIDIVAHEEGIKKQQIVGDALLAYFSDETKEKAKERVKTLSIKNLEKEIEKEKNKQ